RGRRAARRGAAGARPVRGAHAGAAGRLPRRPAALPHPGRGRAGAARRAARSRTAGDRPAGRPGSRGRGRIPRADRARAERRAGRARAAAGGRADRPAARVAQGAPGQRESAQLAALRPEAAAAFHVLTVLELSDVPDEPALRRAVDQIVLRHESLRTVLEPDGLHTRVLPRAAVDLAVVDVDAD